MERRDDGWLWSESNAVHRPSASLNYGPMKHARNVTQVVLGVDLIS